MNSLSELRRVLFALPTITFMSPLQWEIIYFDVFLVYEVFRRTKQIFILLIPDNGRT